MLPTILLFLAILCTLVLLRCLGLLIVDIILYHQKDSTEIYSGDEQSNLYIFCLVLTIITALLYALVYYLSFI